MNLLSMTRGLDRLAGAADSAIARRIAAPINKSIGRVAARGAGRGLMNAASVGARAGLMTGGLALSVGGAAAVGAVGLAYGASRVFNAALNTPTFRAGAGEAPFVDRGGSMVSWQKHGKVPFSNRHFWTPTASPRLSDMVGGSAVLAGMAGGVRDVGRSRNRAVSYSGGVPEIDNDQLMGATGSLALSMYYNRSKRLSPLDRHRQAVEQAQRQDSPLSSAAMSMDRTEMVHALHMAHMAVAG